MDSRTWTLALNTLLLCGATCAVSLPIGCLLAFLFTRTDLPARRIGLGLLAVMLFVPLYLQTAAWQAGFGLQGWFTMVTGSRALLDGWSGAIWVHGVSAVPWVVLIVGAGLWLIEPELEEQALLDASPRQVFFHVTLRSAIPAVGAAALWVVIVTAGEMTVTDLFLVRTYAEEIYTRLAIGPQPGDPPLGLWPGAMLTAALVAAGLALCARFVPRDRPISLRRRWTFCLGSWRWPLAIVVSLMLAVLIGVPLVNLCYKAGVKVTPVENVPVRSWSALKWLAIVAYSPWQYGREFGASLGIGALAATASAAIATALGWFARGGRGRAASVLAVTAICLSIPGPLIGIGIIRLLNWPQVPLLVYLYDRSILAPWLALVVRSLPLATLVMWHALRSIPQAMLDAAAAGGAGSLRRLCRIALPNRLPALALAWVVALAVALGDLAASILVAPPGVTTLSVQIFDLLHSGVEDQVAGICLALVVVFASAAGVAAWLVQRFHHGHV